MPRPKEEESEQAFVSRFMASEEARKDYPDEKQRAAVAYSMYKERNNSMEDGWPSSVDIKFIEPGLVHYQDLNDGKGATVLVQKAVLDRMAQSIIGKPIINWDHKSVNPRIFNQGKAQGVVSDVYYEPTDGWYHAKALVWDEATKRNIVNGFSVSCAYTVNEWGDSAGTRNQVPYEREVLNGTYTHIAVVATPRYEGARIDLLNSQGGSMGILNLFRKDKGEEKMEIDLDKTMVPMGEGQKETSLSELVNSYKKQQALSGGLKDEDKIEVDGKQVSVLELKNAHLAILKNAEEDKMKEDHKDGEHKGENKLKNCPMCNAVDEDEKKKKEEESKNAADEAEKKEEERKNALELELKNKTEQEKAEAKKRFDELENARHKKGELKMPTVTTTSALAEEGASRYGSKK